MTLSKTISTLSLALAMFGSALLIAPSKAEAGNSGHISYEALKRNFVPTGHKNPGNGRAGQPANKYTRGCSAIQHCRG
jgi:hypothetical protein